MNPGEFKDTWLPLKDAVYRVAYYILESVPDAEDAVQDLYLKLWNMGDALDGIKNPKAYCITLIRNICLDRVRGASMSRKASGMPDMASEEEAVDERMSGRQRIEAIKAKMEQLPEKERIVLRMKVFEDLSYEEIQERTGIGYLSLRVLLSNARRKVRTAI